MTRCWAKNVAFSTLKGCANSRTDGCSRKQKKVFWNKQVAFFLKRCNGKFRSRFRIWSESFPDVDIRWNRTFSRLNVPVSVTTFALMSIFPIARLSTRALMLSFNGELQLQHWDSICKICFKLNCCNVCWFLSRRWIFENLSHTSHFSRDGKNILMPSLSYGKAGSIGAKTNYQTAGAT